MDKVTVGPPFLTAPPNSVLQIFLDKDKQVRLFKAKLFENQIDQRLFYLIVPGDRCLPAISGVYVDVMPAAMPFQVASIPGKPFDQAVAFQTATSISMVLDSGCAAIWASSMIMR